MQSKCPDKLFVEATSKFILPGVALEFTVNVPPVLVIAPTLGYPLVALPTNILPFAVKAASEIVLRALPYITEPFVIPTKPVPPLKTDNVPDTVPPKSTDVKNPAVLLSQLLRSIPASTNVNNKLLLTVVTVNCVTSADFKPFKFI